MADNLNLHLFVRYVQDVRYAAYLISGGIAQVNSEPDKRARLC